MSTRTRKSRTPGENTAADTQQEPTAAAAQMAGDLPDQSEVDPTTIKQAVLTKQGYICPAPKVPE